jgi:hypothetical protein
MDAMSIKANHYFMTRGKNYSKILCLFQPFVLSCHGASSETTVQILHDVIRKQIVWKLHLEKSWLEGN